ncbi:ferritin-like domain-containing protein [Chitinophaga nivalis]|uniref:Ferritin-like domain-containing protein n=1 Tax=Chitinophaga nivalis TaxID=2991709 RepID=A0ABT3IVY1_9BACT|nr:ferritin-like domain-containing protein [Chitinophaga nivalis]MCW3462180.1 ferritin-like domain-containing protein [Chitinophaga nivalis]MCW3488128.1 ferritin-like domain-containing protein [Chitinophaga nivalis]
MSTSKITTNGTHNSASGRMNDSKFHALFLEELKDIYWAEKNLVKALPKMQKAATARDLSNAIGNHLEETKEHVARLEEIFELLGKKAQTKKCEAMEGLIAEGKEVISDTDEDSAVRDAGIIIASQKIEHYEIAAYGSLRTLARVMKHTAVAKLLEQTLEEEKNADSLLTEVAETAINAAAAAE